MRSLGVAVAVALMLSTVVGHAQMTGADRANFVTMYRHNCLTSFRSDERFVGVPTRTYAAICTCAGNRIASTLDYAQTWSHYIGPAAGYPQTREETPEMQAAESDAVTFCVSRHSGGGYNGMSVTPNH